MADMTAVTMATYLPVVYSALATITYRANNVTWPLLDHSWEPEIGVGRGSTVDIASFTQNARTDAVKRTTFGTGATLTFNANTEAQVQLVVNTMVYDAYRMPVEMVVQKMPNYDTLLAEGIGTALAGYVDYDVASDNTNGFDAFTAIGTDNVDVTSDVFLQGEQNLNDNMAPVPGRFFVISPATRGSLLNIEVFRNQLYAPAIGNLAGKKGPGYLGPINTLAVYMSANLEAGTSGKKNFMGHTQAIACAMQQNVTLLRGMNIADGLFNETVGYVVYGIKLVKSGFGREVDGK